MRIAIIPARAGSKRIIGKNLSEIRGKPILSYVIETLTAFKDFDRIIVSTDSMQIARVAKESGAEVPFMRPDELADDFASTSDVIQHAIRELRLTSNDIVWCVYPTAISLSSAHLREGQTLKDTGDWDFVFAATEPNSSLWRSFRQEPHGGVEMIFPEFWDTRSQDLPSIYVDAALFYIGTAKAWLDCPSIFTSNSSFIKVPFTSGIDINSDQDFQLLKMIFSSTMNERSE